MRRLKKVLGKPYWWLYRCFLEKIVVFLRRQYQDHRLKRLKNQEFTIFSNNCAGGVIYHALRHRFDSPTINLFMSDEDYFEFLDHWEHYVLQRPEEIFLENVSYPVGVLKREDKQITLHFMHYESFSQACEKWVERAGRIRKDNLYVIFNYGYPVTNENKWVKRFLELPYPNKVMLTHYKNEPNPFPNIYHMRLYEKPCRIGQIFEYRSSLSCRLHLDAFDYIGFLNRGHRE